MSLLLQGLVEFGNKCNVVHNFKGKEVSYNLLSQFWEDSKIKQYDDNGETEHNLIDYDGLLLFHAYKSYESGDVHEYFVVVEDEAQADALYENHKFGEYEGFEWFLFDGDTDFHSLEFSA
ncbi:hypothetical protein FP76_gp152 [Bacillus phage Evoli]|uniref:Uncharacterized protein n=1 Tax=Bacillus phage Evoli TaxID=1486658 RepID=A0A024B0L7_9CAUD|nr:hypothetical protein FP76_gp152 [Bacillus phage Evoli]AHZ09942.1 hypothetical protein [Bacillus phage Evoli]